MKTLKIAIILAAVIAIATVAVGLTFAQNMGDGGMMGYTNYTEDEEWWTDMNNHMGGNWDDIEDEEWYDDMRTYMDEHIAEVESQEWYDDMEEYMEENGHGNHNNGNHMGSGNGGCH